MGTAAAARRGRYTLLHLVLLGSFSFLMGAVVCGHIFMSRLAISGKLQSQSNVLHDPTSHGPGLSSAAAAGGFQMPHATEAEGSDGSIREKRGVDGSVGGGRTSGDGKGDVDQGRRHNDHKRRKGSKHNPVVLQLSQGR